MMSCKPAESLLAEREKERVRSGRFMKRRLEVDELGCYLLHVRLHSRWLVACAATQRSRLLPCHAGLYFTSKRAKLLPLLLISGAQAAGVPFIHHSLQNLSRCPKKNVPVSNFKGALVALQSNS